MTEDLITWLRAQLDDDEETARRALHGPVEEPWRAIHSPTSGSEYDAVGQRGHGHREPDEDGLGTYVVADFGFCGGAMTKYLLRFQPRLQLADIAAKRAILDAYEGALRFYSEPNRDPYLHPDRETLGLGQAVQHLASAYADRLGYREEWRP